MRELSSRRKGYEQESDEAMAIGKTGVMHLPWPDRARFDLNPRTSAEEEQFLKLLVENVHVESQEHAVALLRQMREAGLVIGSTPLACSIEDEHDPHLVEWPDGNGFYHSWRCGGEGGQLLRPPVSAMAFLSGRTDG